MNKTIAKAEIIQSKIIKMEIGINQAYDLFKQSDFPTINIGKRKVVTLASYLSWKMSKKGGV